MAERIVSPGVYTFESDNTFLPPGTTTTVGAFIGLTQKGRAFVPTEVNSPIEFNTKFGSNDKDYLAPTVTKYLANSAGAKIVRVLGLEGWTSNNDVLELVLSSSEGVQKDALVLAKVEGFTGSLADVTITYNSSSGQIEMESAAYGAVTASLDPSSQNYVEKVFGTDPTLTNGSGLASKVYLYKNFKTFQTTYFSGSNVTLTTGSNNTLDFSGDWAQYSHATTPWITSQLIGGEAYNLFQFATIDDGTSANKLYKVVIDSINISNDEDVYSTFNVLVYDFVTGNILESYTNLNLDPESSNYILNRIGDQVLTIDSDGSIQTSGDYLNKSQYIRVIASPGLDKLPYNIVPFGHTQYKNAIAGNLCPTPTFKLYQGDATTYDATEAWGIDFTINDNKELFAPIPSGSSLIGSSLQLSNLQAHPETDYSGSYLYETTVPNEMRKFEVGFQGGWDGIAPNKEKYYGSDIIATNVFGYDCSTASSNGTIAFKKAINALANKDEHDINLLSIPGLLHGTHTPVTSHAMLVAQQRGDVFYVYDSCKLGDSISTAISNVESVDNNYVATYYPWVKISSVINGKIKNMWVPPSVVIPSVLSFSDTISAEWFAPAGLNRGGLDVVDVKKVLSQSQRDTLYEGRINPIAKFPAQGISVWGQKTSQKKASSLDRINVRRLLIHSKKFVQKTGKYIVFDPNTVQTRNAFLAIVNPFFENIKSRQGLYDFRVIMDESINTPDVIDRNMIKGKVFLQPTRAGEFIEVEFNLQPTGVTFE